MINLKFRELPKTIINGDVAYRIYAHDCDLGEVLRDTDGNWKASIPCAEIEVRGQSRNDVFETAQVLYGYSANSEERVNGHTK